MIRSISIQVHIPQGSVNIVQRYLDEIIIRCPRLKILRITIGATRFCDTPTWAHWISSHLSDLHVCVDHEEVFGVRPGFLKALASASSLARLTLSFPHTGSIVDDNPLAYTPVPLHLPSLRELSLLIYSQKDARIVSAIVDGLVEPNISSLTICLVRPRYASDRNEYEDASEHIFRILSRICAHLRYLHLTDQTNQSIGRRDDGEWHDIWNWETTWDNDDFQAILDLCTSLEHFIAPLSSDRPSLALRRHPALKWGDVWMWPSDVQDEEGDERTRWLVTDESSSSFPALERCRKLDVSLNIFLNLPMMFSPRHSSTINAPLYWTLGGSVKIVETSHVIKMSPRRVRSLSSGDLTDLDETGISTLSMIDLDDVAGEELSGEGDVVDDEGDMSIDQSDIDGVKHEGQQTRAYSPSTNESLHSSFEESDDEESEDGYVPSESSAGGSSEYWSDEEDFQMLERSMIVMAQTLAEYAGSIDTYMTSERIWDEYFAVGLRVRTTRLHIYTLYLLTSPTGT